jgi:hypothetical protein
MDLARVKRNQKPEREEGGRTKGQERARPDGGGEQSVPR